jgi:triacylglycerol lipase
MQQGAATLAITALLFCWALPGASAEQSSAKVVLLHGLARSADSMAPMAARLEEAGYAVCNVSYPSREHAIEQLASEHVVPAIGTCFGTDPGKLSFVTHSLGGIIVRQLAASGTPLRFGRVVMLAPPNGGSEVVDSLGEWRLFSAINGDAGRQLGTDDASLPRALGPAPFELGIITGDRSINLILSSLIPGADDGKVSVENAKLEGMRDFLVMPVSHPFIMKDEAVATQVLHFLRHGRFEHRTATAVSSPD